MFLMQALDINVHVPDVCMVDAIEARDLSESRSGVFRKWMQSEAIEP